jgi:DNA-binding transcriptional ArsR family regulator
MITVSPSSLRVYIYILKKGSRNGVGVREVMRDMGFSSPSSAVYHLEKLRRLGLVEKDMVGRYYIKIRFHDYPLNAFVFLKGHIIPKHGLYAVVLSVFIFNYIVLFLNQLSWSEFLALIPAILACIILYYEMIIERKALNCMMKSNSYSKA